MVHMLKSVIIAVMLAIFLPAAVALNAAIDVQLIGYGKNYQEVHISIKNTGEAMISDITLYIDEEAYKTIEGVSGPGITFEEVLFLEEGMHLIEARSPEGAYDSLGVTVSEGKAEQPHAVTEEPGPPDWIMENLLWIVLVVAVLVFVVSLWYIREGAYAKRE